MPDTNSIVVIGGGFAGAAFALHFLRDHPGTRADLTIVEPRATLGAGLAYSAEAPEHRTNVAAMRMSVFPDDPGNFDQWLRDEGEPLRDPSCVVPDVGLFPSRAVFGRYVDAMLRQQAGKANGVTFTHRRARATAVVPHGAGFSVTLDDGSSLPASTVVLAIGHTVPDLPAMLRGVPGVIADPWDTAAVRAIPKDARVLVVGTGLTACDIIASLQKAGHQGPITAVSRHGLLPRPRTRLPVSAEGDFSTAPEHTAVGLLRRVRKAVAAAAEQGHPWENIVDALRQQASSAWGTLSWNQRTRLLRHLRTYWDVHRFQCAPQIDATVRGLQESGQLHVRAASLLGVGAGRAALRPRGASEPELLPVDVIVNCTGPGHRSVTEQHPVLRGLASEEMLQADPARLGILVDDESRVIKATGEAWPNLFVAGPLARGTHGELMGLPQVNLQPRAVATSVASLATGSAMRVRELLS